MSRGAMIAVLLLLATNAAWCVAWLARRPHAADAAFVEGHPSDGADRVAGRTRDAAAPQARREGNDRDGDAAAGLLLLGEEESAAHLRGREREDPETPSADRAGPEEPSPEAIAERARQRAAREYATAMMRKIAQVKDAAVRQEGLAELTDALSSDDPLAVEYGLSVLHQLPGLGLEIDLGSFRTLVTALLDSESPGIRRSSLYALRATDPDGADVRLALAAADDPSPIVRGHAARLLNPKTQREALQLVVRFGDASLAPQLERFAENPLVNAKVRELARKAVAYLNRDKPAR